MVLDWLFSFFKRKIKTKKIKVEKKVKKRTKKIKRMVKIKRKVKPEKKKILVSELMTKNIISVDPHMGLNKVAEIFQNKKISGAPVLDKGFFIGEISKTDILKIVKKNNLEEIEEKDKEVLKNTIVADIMKKPICIGEDKSVEEAKKKMEKYNIKRLLVLDKKGRLVGIITRTDLLKWAPKQEIKETVSTKIDEMLKILEEGPVELQKLSKLLNTPENLVENWAKILEEHGIVEINYPAIGSPVVKMKKQE
ncbi:MAG: CBS domain-containing protein [Candidatus Aenigmatarchaeota archaeon]